MRQHPDLCALYSVLCAIIDHAAIAAAHSMEPLFLTHHTTNGKGLKGEKISFFFLLISPQTFDMIVRHEYTCQADSASVPVKHSLSPVAAGEEAGRGK